MKPNILMIALYALVVVLLAMSCIVAGWEAVCFGLLIAVVSAFVGAEICGSSRDLDGEVAER